MIRRIRIAAAAVMVAAGLIGAQAAPASASFDHHFRVFEKVSFNPTPNEQAFRFKGKLFDPGNRHNRVGRDHGVCKVRPHNALKCRGTYHLNGEMGGVGDIKVRGNLRQGDNRLSVVGGTGDFNGVAGKEVIRDLNQRGTKSIDKFDLR